MIEDMLDTIGEMVSKVMERVLQWVTVDDLHVHEDMAGKSGPLWGPQAGGRLCKTLLSESLAAFKRSRLHLVFPGQRWEHGRSDPILFGRGDQCDVSLRAGGGNGYYPAAKAIWRPSGNKGRHRTSSPCGAAKAISSGSWKRNFRPSCEREGRCLRWIIVFPTECRLKTTATM